MAGLERSSARVLRVAAAVAVPLALFLLGFCLLFDDGARGWVGRTFVGCDGDVTTVDSGADDPEPGVEFFCDVDGRRRRIDAQLALLAFAPFAAFVVLPAGVVALRHRRRSRRRVRRRPVGPGTELAQRVLRRLEEAGVDWAPRPLGVDHGEERLTWIPGDTPTSGDDVDIAELAAMVRRLHDLTVGFVDGCECIVHDDPQPRNVVVRDGRTVGIVDWEQVRPGRRVDDVANLCWSFVEPAPGADPEDVGRRWRAVVDAYGLDADGRRELVATVLARMATCIDDIERNAGVGSARHRRLAERGDHLAIRAMRAWVVDHAAALDAAVTAP